MPLAPVRILPAYKKYSFEGSLEGWTSNYPQYVTISDAWATDGNYSVAITDYIVYIQKKIDLTNVNYMLLDFKTTGGASDAIRVFINGVQVYSFDGLAEKRDVKIDVSGYTGLCTVKIMYDLVVFGGV